LIDGLTWASTAARGQAVVDGAMARRSGLRRIGEGCRRGTGSRSPASGRRHDQGCEGRARPAGTSRVEGIGARQHWSSPTPGDAAPSSGTHEHRRGCRWLIDAWRHPQGRRIDGQHDTPLHGGEDTGSRTTSPELPRLAPFLPHDYLNLLTGRAMMEAARPRDASDVRAGRREEVIEMTTRLMSARDTVFDEPAGTLEGRRRGAAPRVTRGRRANMLGARHGNTRPCIVTTASAHRAHLRYWRGQSSTPSARHMPSATRRARGSPLPAR
jgi:hypothetical protein